MSAISPVSHGGIDSTLGAAANEEASLPDKVLGDISKLLESVGHCGWVWRKASELGEGESGGIGTGELPLSGSCWRGLSGEADRNRNNYISEWSLAARRALAVTPSHQLSRISRCSSQPDDIGSCLIL